jgi:hypothetical protein
LQRKGEKGKGKEMKGGSKKPRISVFILEDRRTDRGGEQYDGG